ncbi:MAG: hypothetical protein WA364_05705 [Candidatus Nitrosopolaris sp.]
MSNPISFTYFVAEIPNNIRTAAESGSKIPSDRKSNQKSLTKNVRYVQV